MLWPNIRKSEKVSKRPIGATQKRKETSIEIECFAKTFFIQVQWSSKSAPLFRQVHLDRSKIGQPEIWAARYGFKTIFQHM